MREAAAVRAVEARAEVVLDRLDVQPVDDPVGALLKVTAEVISVKSWLADRFNAADAASEFLLAEMLGRGLDRASRLLIELHRLGLAERQAQLDQDLARLLAGVVRGVLVDVGVDPDDREVRGVVRRHFERAGELDEARR